MVLPNESDKTRHPHVIFNAYLTASTGYGTAARAYVDAFLCAGLEVVAIDRSGARNIGRGAANTSYIKDGSWKPEVVICHDLPYLMDSLRIINERLVVLTTWEADSLPRNAIDRLNGVREVWVPSLFNCRTFERQLERPVRRVPHPVRQRTHHVGPPVRIETMFGVTDEDFVFTTIATWQERKNLLGVIDSFMRALAGVRNAVLIIKTHFEYTSRSEVLALANGIIARQGVSGNGARVCIEGAKWSDELIEELMARTNCYVSLHRSEGWCYPLFDAACDGIPIVATAYSGPLDYLSDQHHRLVEYALVDCRPGQDTAAFGFDSSMQWAEPDLEHAAHLLHQVYFNRASERQNARGYSQEIRERYSREHVGKLVVQLLTNLVSG